MIRRFGPGIVLGLLLFAVAALIVGQLLSGYGNRKSIAEYQRAGCARGLFDRADAIEADRDEATFRRDAAAAREAAGDLAVAAAYRRSARRAERRARRRAARMLGADARRLGRVDRYGRPVPSAVRLAQRTCARAVPSASLL